MIDRLAMAEQEISGVRCRIETNFADVSV